MNIIINGFHAHGQLDTVVRIAHAVSPGDIHHIATRELRAAVHEKLPHARVLCWEDLYWGGFAVHGTVPGHPVDAEFLGRLSRWEGTALKMMDRFEFLSDWNYHQRKRAWIGYVTYWYAFLQTHQIKLIVSQNVPHEVFDFILYVVAKELGVPTLMFYQSQIRDIILPLDSHDGAVRGFPPAYQAFKSRSDTIKVSSSVEAEIQSTLAAHVPFYMKSSSLLTRLLGGFKRAYRALLREFHPDPSGVTIPLRFRLRALRQQIVLSNRKRALDREYRALQKDPVPGVPYIYLPLHYQPELTTSPLAGEWVDQKLVVQILEEALPEGWMVYVKEHPKQTAVSRYPGFYRELASSRRVQLVPKSTDSFALSDQSRAVATCTGTAGWEGLLRGKPVLVFGNIFYRDAPGAFSIANRQDIVTALSSISGSSVDKAERLIAIRVFLAALESVTIRGFCDPVYAATSGCTQEESNRNLSNYILKVVDEMIKNSTVPESRPL